MSTLLAVEVWEERRRRALQLADRHPHAAEILGLYAALCEASGPLADRAREDRPERARLAAYVAEQALPGVMDVTLRAGPEKLQQLVLTRFHEADLQALVERWLGGGELSLADRYLVRAGTAPVLEALPDLLGAVGDDAKRCPGCGGLPQLSYFGASGEVLVTAPRQLLCSRCSRSWPYPRMVCAGCGSTESSQLPIFADPERFPNVRVDACEACRTYLLTVEMAKEPAAVPIVDELAALPLDLYARERGFKKLTPNLVGF